MNREQWLQAAVGIMREDFDGIGMKLPDTIHVSVGFPSKGALSATRRVLGQCWGGLHSEDGSPHVFVTPLVNDGVRALGILRHELIHATGIFDHGRRFAKAAAQLGLEGKPTATTESADLQKVLAHLIETKLGAYPHSALAAVALLKKQTTRMLKVVCPGCGYTVRTTAKWLEVGTPTCPCGSMMECPED